MKFRKCTIILCSLLFSLFISFSLILLSQLSDENKLFEKFENKIDVNDTDIKLLLKTRWNEEAEENLSRKLIKLYSINRHISSNLSPWVIARNWVTASEIHPEFPAELGHVMESMWRRKITWAGLGHKGTQLKLTLSLEGGQYAIFKPKWYERDAVIRGQPYEGHDRHNGEIAAFHLNRIMGLRRAPIVVGRVVDLQEEVMPVASKKLRQTFFVKNGTNVCFLGRCLYCKTREDAACGDGVKMEGAMVLWLPRNLTFTQYRHPWSRTYNTHRKASWELADMGPSYCNVVQQMPLFNASNNLLLDIIDTAIFDFIIGNADRHHFEVFANSSDPRLLLIDNAKSFGNPDHDEKSILAPLLQCKFVRKSTVMRLNEMKDGIAMRVLKAVLTSDPVAPIINDQHLMAIDRRVNNVIDILQEEHFVFV